LLISSAAALAICVALFAVDKKISLGLAAGYATGMVDYFLITSQVRKITSSPGKTAGKVMAGGFFYMLRFAGAAAIIAVVLKNGGSVSIGGFLAGFTVCVAVEMAAHRLNP